MTDTITEATAWTIDWRGHTWHSTDLTGNHAAAVAELLGVDPGWEWFDVAALHPARGPLHVMALVAAFLCIDSDVRGMAARTAVLAGVKEATVDELVAAVHIPS